MAKDFYHDVVKEALKKDGWTITHDPLRIKSFEEVKLEIDLGAEKLFSATKGSKKIAVEVKGFHEQSNIYAFHQALGQYMDYIVALKPEYPDFDLYLAVPIDIFLEFFQLAFIRKVLKTYQMRILVFHPISKSIESWEIYQ